MAYSYDLVFKKTADHGNADALSRLPLDFTTPANKEIVDIFMTEAEEMTPAELSNKVLVEKIKKDQVLQQVIRCLEHHQWPTPVPCDLVPYYKHREELSVENSCVYWGSRLIIPNALRPEVMKELHQGHPGIVRMKSLARSFVWWPNLDADIEKRVQTCVHCQSVRPEAPEAPVHPWEFPEKPWYRLHIDYAGPFHGFMWLIVVDARTKWPEVIRLKSSTSEATVTALLNLIARFGVPKQIVSDNGPQFTSEEFRLFCDRFKIQHVRTSPYHPRSNGEAERFVRTFKNVLGMKKVSLETISYRLTRFLLSYRNTIHPTTGFTPAQLLIGHRARFPLDNIRSNPEDCVRKQQEAQAGDKQERIFRSGDPVLVRMFNENKPTWLSGSITKRVAPLTYHVECGGKFHKRHIDHLIARDPALQLKPPVRPLIFPTVTPPVDHPNPAAPDPVQDAPPVLPPEAPVPIQEPVQPPENVPRRSTRVSKPVVRPYDDYLSGKRKK
jgi:hypothetical protein